MSTNQNHTANNTDVIMDDYQDCLDKAIPPINGDNTIPPKKGDNTIRPKNGDDQEEPLLDFGNDEEEPKREASPNKVAKTRSRTNIEPNKDHSMGDQKNSDKKKKSSSKKAMDNETHQLDDPLPMQKKHSKEQPQKKANDAQPHADRKVKDGQPDYSVMIKDVRKHSSGNVNDGQFRAKDTRLIQAGGRAQQFVSNILFNLDFELLQLEQEFKNGNGPQFYDLQKSYCQMQSSQQWIGSLSEAEKQQWFVNQQKYKQCKEKFEQEALSAQMTAKAKMQTPNIRSVNEMLQAAINTPEQFMHYDQDQITQKLTRRGSQEVDLKLVFELLEKHQQVWKSWVKARDLKRAATQK